MSDGLADLDRIAAAWAERAVRAYQRWLSPLKGPHRACAYRVAHGGESCAACARRLLARHGFRAAVPLVLERFAQCGRAAQALAVARATEPPRLAARRRRYRGQCCIVIPLPACGAARTRV